MGRLELAVTGMRITGHDSLLRRAVSEWAGFADDWQRDEMRAADRQWGDVPDVDELSEHEKRQMRAEW